MLTKEIEKEIRCTIRTSMQILAINSSSNEISSEDVYNYTLKQFPSITRNDIERVFYKYYNPEERDGILYISL